MPSPEVIEFAGFVLLHCGAVADGNRGGELICPYAVIADAAGKRVIDFESETQEEAVSKGWASLSDSRQKGEWWAFGREGLYREPDQSTDVLLVSVWAPGMPDVASVIQRFARGPSQELYLLGSPELLIHGSDGAEPVDEWDREALQRGIVSHPRGALWSGWCPQ